ncbi:hypothetical protein PC128_g18779 [Phytophthora cactorum]|nr:hypothetical protein PC120_g6743 [Phytophthora cactorum]KAG3171229.1 hypothetical protein PC128_g18779 [Phytophthora cactorum]
MASTVSARRRREGLTDRPLGQVRSIADRDSSTRRWRAFLLALQLLYASRSMRGRAKWEGSATCSPLAVARALQQTLATPRHYIPAEVYWYMYSMPLLFLNSRSMELHPLDSPMNRWLAQLR